MKIISISVLFFLVACTLEPKYIKPNSPVELKQEELVAIEWKNFFQNKEFEELIDAALENNRDLKLAYLNIELARQNYNVQTSFLMPTVNASGGYVKTSSNIAPFIDNGYNGSFGITNYEIDLFGKLRSGRKAAQEAMLATEEAKNTIRITLITDVSHLYVQFLTLTENIALLKDDLTLQQNIYKLIKAKENQGYASRSDLLTAENKLEQTKIALTTQEALLLESKTALSLLVGTSVENILNAKINLNDVKLAEEKLIYVPSIILLSRPDIKSAEHTLKSANANIGVARAAFFPSLTLTTSLGFQDPRLERLLSKKNEAWQFAPGISVPIFTGGFNMANLRISQAQQKIAITQYEKTIQVAFKEVQDALNAREFKNTELQNFLKIARNVAKIYKIQQQNLAFGNSSKLDTMEVKLNLNSAKRAENTAKQSYISSVITSYKVLGQAL